MTILRKGKSMVIVPMNMVKQLGKIAITRSPLTKDGLAFNSLYWF